MSDRRATRPLNVEAVKAANAAVAKETGGRPLTMGPEDAALRKKWMDAYIAAGGNSETIGPSGKKPKDVTEGCTPSTPSPEAKYGTTEDLLKNLEKCDGGTDIYAKAKAANGGKDPVIKPGDGGQVDLSKGEITLDKDNDTCLATQQLIQELSNLSRKADFEKLDNDALAGDVSRGDYIKETERIEYESGVKNILQAFDACKETWCCQTSQKEWARSATGFDDYYDNYLSDEHKEHYGQWWDSACKEAYEKKHP